MSRQNFLIRFGIPLKGAARPPTGNRKRTGWSRSHNPNYSQETNADNKKRDRRGHGRTKPEGFAESRHHARPARFFWGIHNKPYTTSGAHKSTGKPRAKPKHPDREREPMRSNPFDFQRPALSFTFNINLKTSKRPSYAHNRNPLFKLQADAKLSRLIIVRFFKP